MVKNWMAEPPSDGANCDEMSFWDLRDTPY